MKERIKQLIEQARSGVRRRVPKFKKQKPKTSSRLSPTSRKAWELCLEVNSNERGTVYFVESNGFIKIGYTKGTAKGRIADFSTGSPFEYCVLATVQGGRELERALHRVFHTQRHKGEWFYGEGALREFVTALREHPIPRKVKERLAEKTDVRATARPNSFVWSWNSDEVERLSLLTELNAMA